MIKEVSLTSQIIEYVRTHYSVESFLLYRDAMVKTTQGIVNRCGPKGIEVNRKWYSFSEASQLIPE